MIAVALIAGLLAGVVGAMGLGGGAVLIIYLTVFADIPQLKAQGINLIFFLPIGAVAVAIYAKRKEIRWRVVLPVICGGVVGSVLGLLLTKLIGGTWTAKIFGALLIFWGMKEVFSNFGKTALEKRKK